METEQSYYTLKGVIAIFKMFFYYKTFFILISIFFLSACADSPSRQSAPPIEASKGLLDLSGYSFPDRGCVSLTGEWDFYWNQLLEPDQIATASGRSHIRVPRFWSFAQLEGEGERLPGRGYATYHLQVRLPDSQENAALKLPPIASAYRLYINGRLAASQGVVGSSRESSEPSTMTRVVNVHQLGDSLDITLQVSNFDLRRGGIRGAIELGTEHQLQRSYTKEIAGELFLIGCTFMMGLYHLGMYTLRKYDRFTLYFGLFCLMIGMRSMFGGGNYIYYLFKGIPWILAVKLEFLGYGLGFLFGLLFMKSMYPKEVNGIFVKLCMLFVGLSCLLVLFAPVYIFTLPLQLYQTFMAAALLYLIAALIGAMRRRREGALLTALGVCTYSAIILLDIASSNEWIAVNGISPLGLLFVVFVHSLLICLKFTKSYASKEEMSRQLRELNCGLEVKIQERTTALEQYNLSLMKMNEELERMEASRKHLLTNISHDLGTPMTLIQGYVEALLDGVVEGPEQQRKYLRLIHARVTGLHRLIQDLFQLSKLEARQISFDFVTMEVASFIRNVQERYETEIAAAGIAAIVEAPSPEAQRARLLKVDILRMDQVLTNLIFNAIKYTPQGGIIRLSFTLEESSLHVRIDDTGLGIAAADLPYVFDRFYKKEKSRNSGFAGTGLGLAIAKEIVEFHGGTIWIGHNEPEGTTVCFALPTLPSASSEGGGAFKPG